MGAPRRGRCRQGTGICEGAVHEVAMAGIIALTVRTGVIILRPPRRRGCGAANSMPARVCLTLGVSVVVSLRVAIAIAILIVLILRRYRQRRSCAADDQCSPENGYKQLHIRCS